MTEMKYSILQLWRIVENKNLDNPSVTDKLYHNVVHLDQIFMHIGIISVCFVLEYKMLYRTDGFLGVLHQDITEFFLKVVFKHHITNQPINISRSLLNFVYGGEKNQKNSCSYLKYNIMSKCNTVVHLDQIFMHIGIISVCFVLEYKMLYSPHFKSG
jgi:hypothetical protein